MEYARRYYVVAGLALALLGTALVVDRAFPLLGAIGLGAWLLAHQYRFARRAGRLVEAVTVDVRVAGDPVTVDGDVTVEVDVTTTEPAPLAATVVPSVPAAGRAVEPVEPAALEAGGDGTRLAYAVRFPVAGSYRFDRARLALVDDYGLFSATVEAGDRPTVTVEPSGPRNLRIGRAGERAVSVYGDDPGPRADRGIEPEEVRPYRAGDRAATIDWRATARLNELHVREFRLDVSGRSAALLVDRRARLAVGPPGETMLDYARAVGLAYLADAVRSATRFSLYLVDEDVVRLAGALRKDAGGYHRLRQSLRDLSAGGRRRSGSSPASSGRPPEVVGRRVADGGTAFERGLRPFFDVASRGARRVVSTPLESAVRTWVAASSPPRESVIVTDDADRAAIREAVAAATAEGGRVTALLLPRVLFEAADPLELEAAYDRYRSFETFRQRLDRPPNVTALEVGPGDRIDAILAAGAGG